MPVISHNSRYGHSFKHIQETHCFKIGLIYSHLSAIMTEKGLRLDRLCGLWHALDRQTDRQTDRQKDRKTERQTDRQTERQKDRKTERQKDRKTDDVALSFLNLQIIKPTDALLVKTTRRAFFVQ